MKHLFLLFFSLTLVSALCAQELSVNEAKAVVEELLEINVISENGKNFMHREIENYSNSSDSIYYAHSYTSYVQEFNSSFLVLLLYNAFRADYLFRSGHFVETEFKFKVADECGLDWWSDEVLKMYYQKRDSLYKNFIGFKIEKRIKPEKGWNKRASSNGRISPVCDDYDLISHQRSVYGKTLYRTLLDLKACGLIDDRIFQEAELQVTNKTISIEPDLLEYVLKRKIYYSDFDQSLLREKDFTQQLIDADIIEEINATQFLDQQDTLIDVAKFIHSCKYGKSIDVKTYKGDIRDNIRQIYTEISEIVPDLKDYSWDFTFSLENEDKWGDLMFEYHLSSILTTDSLEFENTCFFNMAASNREMKAQKLYLSIENFNNLNYYLKSVDSKYRVFQIFDTSVRNDRDHFNFICLTKEQFEILTSAESKFKPSKSTF